MCQNCRADGRICVVGSTFTVKLVLALSVEKKGLRIMSGDSGTGASLQKQPNSNPVLTLE